MVLFKHGCQKNLNKNFHTYEINLPDIHYETNTVISLKCFYIDSYLLNRTCDRKISLKMQPDALGAIIR